METGIRTTPRLLTLIEAASMRAGNDNRLARMIEAKRANLSQWRHGLRSCPLEAQVLMASIAGRDVQKEIADALIEQNANTPRGEKLVSALGKGLMASTGAIPFMLSANDALASNIPVGIELLRYVFRAFL